MSTHMALAYTPVGWAAFEQLLHTLAIADQEAVIKLVDEAIEHIINSNGAHLLRFENLDPSRVELYILVEHIPSMGIPDSEFRFMAMDVSTGQTDYQGNWEPNDFDIRPRHYIFTDFGTNYALLTYSGLAVHTPASVHTTTGVAPAINNHTCIVCGNNRCSTTETSCWKCGALIRP